MFKHLDLNSDNCVSIDELEVFLRHLFTEQMYQVMGGLATEQREGGEEEDCFWSLGRGGREKEGKRGGRGGACVSKKELKVFLRHLFIE